MYEPLVLFDGLCNLCDSTVQFIIKEDKKNIFKFSNIQSEFAEDILRKRNLESESLKTVILFYKNKIYIRSNAILKILILLGGYLKLFAYIISLIPSPIRDWVYNLIAKRCYLWFGKKEQCILPTPELKNKFL